MFNSLFQRQGFLFRLAAILFVLTACDQNVDLSAVTKLAATTAASANSFTALAQDMNASCARTYEWEWAAARSFAGFPALNDVCASNQAAANQWQSANLTLLSYIRALGALAGGNDTQTDYGIPGLVQGITSITGGLSSSQVNSISSSATALVTDIYNFRRRQDISKYAPAADKDLDALIDVLEDVAKTNYGNQLTFETDSINHFYRPVVGAAVPAAQPGSPVPSSMPAVASIPYKVLNDFDKVQLLQLRDHYRTDRDELDKRRAAIGAYVNSLEAIRHAHGALVSSIQSNTIADAAKVIQAYVDQLVPNIQQLNKAVNGGSRS